MTQILLGEFGSVRNARKAREAFAGEVEARLDPAADAYVYERAGVPRRLLVNKTDGGSYEVLLEIDHLTPVEA